MYNRPPEITMGPLLKIEKNFLKMFTSSSPIYLELGLDSRMR